MDVKIEQNNMKPAVIFLNTWRSELTGDTAVYEFLGLTGAGIETRLAHGFKTNQTPQVIPEDEAKSAYNYLLEHCRAENIQISERRYNMFAIRFEQQGLYRYLVWRKDKISEVGSDGLEAIIPKDWKGILFLPANVNVTFDRQARYDLTKFLGAASDFLLKPKAVLLELHPALKTEWVSRHRRMTIDLFTKKMYDESGKEAFKGYYAQISCEDGSDINHEMHFGSDNIEKTKAQILKRVEDKLCP